MPQDILTGKQIDLTANTLTKAIVADITSNALKGIFTKDADDGNDQQRPSGQQNQDKDNGQYVTVEMLKTFGEGLMNKINETLVASLKKSDNADPTADSADDDSANDKDKDKNLDKSKKTDSKDKSDPDSKAKGFDADVFEKAIDASLRKILGVEDGGTLSKKKSYLVSGEGKLVKAVDGVAPDGSTTINPDTISDEEWDGLPSETRETILNQEMSRRMNA